MPTVPSPNSNQTSAWHSQHRQPERKPLKHRRRESTTEQVIDTDPHAESLLPSPRSSSRGPSSRKRQKTRRFEVSDDDSHAPPLANDECFLRPPEFWDNLSHIPLVKAALHEHNRRNKSLGLLETRRRSTLLDSNIQRCARQGSPDLSDLRGLPPTSMPGDQRRPEPTRNSGGARKRQVRRGGRGGRNDSGSHSASASTSASFSALTQNTQSRSGTARGVSAEDRSSHTTSNTKSSSPYDAAFKQALIDGSVWPIDHVLSSTLDVPPPPDNLDEISSAICGTSRISSKPQTFTVEDWKSFRNAHNRATSEEARSRVLDGIIEGATLSLDTADVKQGLIILSNLLPLLPNLVPGNPDRAYGARPETLHKSVRDALGKLILPTTALDLLCPNFVLHVESPKGGSETAGLQAVYDGALAARGMDALWRWSAEDDGNANANANGEGNIARTITCTYASDGVLRMFAVHSRRRRRQYNTSLMPEEQGTIHRLQDVEYITTRIGGWFMAESVQHFTEGAAAFRNGIEWARKQRGEVIQRANRRALTIAQPQQLGLSPDAAACEHLSHVAGSVAIEHHRSGSPESDNQSSADSLAT